MPGTADPIEAILRQAFQLQRLNNAIARDSTGILRALFDSIVADIARLDPTAPSALRYRRDRVAKLLDRIEALTGEAFIDWTKNVRGDLARLGRAHGLQTRADLVATLGTAGDAVKAVAPTQNMLKAILDTDPFRGETLQGWAAVQEQSTVRRMRRVLQRGMMEERDIGWIVRQVRGGSGVKGIWQATRREAEAVVRTAVTHTATQSALLTYRTNRRVTKQGQYVATLDSRTTDICLSLDGKVFDWDDATAPWPPNHMNCRSSQVPIVDWEGLGLEPPDESERFARTADGKRTQVPGSWNAGKWLREQPAGYQDEILGPRRAKLFRDGKITLDDLVRGDRSVVTLAELERKVAA